MHPVSLSAFNLRYPKQQSTKTMLFTRSPLRTDGKATNRSSFELQVSAVPLYQQQQRLIFCSLLVATASVGNESHIESNYMQCEGIMRILDES